MLNISTVVFKKLFQPSSPKCPKSVVHEISTNFRGDFVCINCNKRIEELKKEVISASSRAIL
jgi:tRNA(Ile2) C34 agmatinyltransferase TiaS